MTTEKPIWVAVRVERGFPVQVKGFTSEPMAHAQERRWRKAMNPDYDETATLQLQFTRQA